MKSVLKITIVAFAVLVSGCTISHEFGPYKGKVVDAETAKPIEGAVVFMRFFTEGQLSPGGPVYKFADAIEVLTDANGDFFISPHRISLFRVPHLWSRHGLVTIFKPGYGAYPSHPQSAPFFDAGSLPENEYVTVKLPKLKTREERIDNLGYAHAFSASEMELKQYKLLLRLYNIENKKLGLQPVLTD